MKRGIIIKKKWRNWRDKVEVQGGVIYRESEKKK